MQEHKMKQMRLLAIGVLVTLGVAFADNGALTSGGLPSLMSQHPYVKMAWEKVALTIHDHFVDTDCTFSFQNTGPTCKVRMGFPDFGMFAYAQTLKPPRTMFTLFESFVDGKRVSTTLEGGKKPGEQWQVKLVDFAPGQSRLVREHYHTDLGGISAKVVIGMASYLLHTGASWKGNIGEATITVTFAPESEVQSPLVLSRLEDLRTEELWNAALTKPGGVAYQGPGAPKQDGLTLTFHRKDWRPTDKDDVMVAFLFPPKLLQKIKAAYDKGGQ